MSLYDNIYSNLLLKVDTNTRFGMKMFFKEQVKILGIRTPDVKSIAREYKNTIKELKKDVFLDLVKRFCSDGNLETFILANEFLKYRVHELDTSDYQYLYGILQYNVDNWAKCDGLCTGVLSQYFYKNQALVTKLNEYNESQKIWIKRASLVSFIAGKTKNQLLRQEFELAKKNALHLINDKEDLLQKACGWLLREMYKLRPLEVNEFIYINRKGMARTTLRYAIEKMSDSERKEMMN